MATTTHGGQVNIQNQGGFGEVGKGCWESISNALWQVPHDEGLGCSFGRGTGRPSLFLWSLFWPRPPPIPGFQCEHGPRVHPHA